MHDERTSSYNKSSFFFLYLYSFLQIFEMMDAKARQDCIKEIDLLRVSPVDRVPA